MFDETRRIHYIRYMMIGPISAFENPEVLMPRSKSLQTIESCKCHAPCPCPKLFVGKNVSEVVVAPNLSEVYASVSPFDLNVCCPCLTFRRSKDSVWHPTIIFLKLALKIISNHHEGPVWLGSMHCTYLGACMVVTPEPVFSVTSTPKCHCKRNRLTGYSSFDRLRWLDLCARVHGRSCHHRR